ncbi:KilA-N domain-containing protein [Pseudomonas syringae]|uniref:KilA-N domain-containing protein n=1 Tax=Pseudomonas syringae TaxID=317 RepID=UPI003F84F4D7
MTIKTNVLPISLPNDKGELHTFEANDDGMYNLTDIWRTLELPKSKLPSQWDNESKRYLSQNGNFHSANSQDKNTLATEQGTIAYAMWVSTEFYMLVVNTFIALRNDSIASAVVLAKLNKEQRGLLQRSARSLSLLDHMFRRPRLRWKELALLAGIEHPIKCKDVLLRRGYIKEETGTNDAGRSITQVVPTAYGQRHGIVPVWAGLMGWQFAFNHVGRDWVIRHADTMNAVCRRDAKIKREQNAARRRAGKRT